MWNGHTMYELSAALGKQSYLGKSCGLHVGLSISRGAPSCWHRWQSEQSEQSEQS